MTSLTAVFQQRVRDHMASAPITVAPDTGCGDVVRRMAEARANSAIVAAADGALVGIVTEQDVTRRMVFRTPSETPIEQVMTAPVITVRDRDYLYDAIATMRRRRLRHIPVVGDGRKVIGLIELENALAVASAPALRLIDALCHEEDTEGLAQVKAAQVEVAAALFDDKVPAPDIQRLLTDINEDIHQRVIEALLRDMAAEGLGEPPVPFAFVVMGSGGRGENFLYPDQDNGLVLADYPDAEHDRIDGFFMEFAGRLNDLLDTVGFPRCNGYVMAINPLWRKTLSQWREQIRLWGTKENPVAICLADIFFDFRTAYGEETLGKGLRDVVTESARRNPHFLRRMEAQYYDTRAAIGLFGRFITERKKAEFRGQINLKHSGTLPLVESARLLALREGVAETSTLARLDGLRGLEVLSADEHEYLVGAYALVTRLLLREQVRSFQAGAAVTNYVRPDSLSNRDKDLLRAAFRAIERFRKRVHAEFTGEVF